MRVVSNGRRRGAISRIMTVILILVIIVLTAIWFGVRSEGGRELIESRLSTQLGIPVSIEKTRIGLPYVLVLENVRTAEFEAAGTAGFSVAEVRLGRRLLSWDLRLRQLMVRLQEDGTGGWLPASLMRLGDLKQAGTRDVVRMSDGIRDKVRLRLLDSSIAWLDVDGREVASVRGVEFRMLPVRIEERRLHYFSLDIYQAVGIALAGGRDMRWEWLTTQELEYIELSSASQHPPDVYGEEDSVATEITSVTD
jgi:hypothetical protein